MKLSRSFVPLLLLAVTSIAVWGCRNAQKVAAQTDSPTQTAQPNAPDERPGSDAEDITTYTGPKLSWGSIGGVTGGGREYTLLPSGQMYIKDIDPQNQNAIPVPTKKISTSRAEALFESAREALAEPPGEFAPGNMNYFIFLDNDEAANRIIYSENAPPPPVIQLLYEELEEL